MVGIAGQAAGIGLFWLVQRRYQISTQAMLLFVAFWILFLNLWGVIGCGTTKIGYHNQWEFWFYQGVTYGVLACPWYAYSQVRVAPWPIVGSLLIALPGGLCGRP